MDGVTNPPRLSVSYHTQHETLTIVYRNNVYECMRFLESHLAKQTPAHTVTPIILRHLLVPGIVQLKLRMR